MNKLLTAVLLCAMAGTAMAQKLPETQDFGKIDIADLEMKECDFEKDANAEVLFAKGRILIDDNLNVISTRHKRIKIFNDNGKGEADIHISYNPRIREYIRGLQAQTINLVDGKIEVIKVDKKLIYTKPIDKSRSEMVFTLPNVKPGSVIEIKYNHNSPAFFNVPTWFFQEKIPVRYSELTTEIPDILNYRKYTRTIVPFIKRTSMVETQAFYSVNKDVMAVANVPSLRSEVYMASFADNLLSVAHQLSSITSTSGPYFNMSFSNTWAKIAANLADDEDFGGQLKRKLKGEELIIEKAKTLKTDEEKIAYIFSEVKNTMKWNTIDCWWTIDGTSKAWDAKIGNSTEVNLILYHLLKQSGVGVYPMVVSTREHGKVVPHYTSLSQFNRTVVYAPLDSAHKYILDATGKYNAYNETPAELLNSQGLYIDKAEERHALLFIDKIKPARQTVWVTAEIKPDGKLDGNATFTNFSYNRVNAVEKYRTDGEKKYIDYLRNDDNNLRISTLKLTNLDIDTLPLVQEFKFNLDLAGSDENYIYINPNVLSPLRKNPFLSESRMTDVDFGYLNSYVISGTYKIPAGFKVDALPQSAAITMADKGIVFRRMLGEQNGMITMRYTIDYQKKVFFKESYDDFREFFKKMHEMLNEQIILKKS